MYNLIKDKVINARLQLNVTQADYLSHLTAPSLFSSLSLFLSDISGISKSMHEASWR
jgi:hypothetical protein